MNWQKFKNLDYLVEQNEDTKICVVLFHGYGADASDLASLSRVFQLSELVDWYFPQGVLEVPIGPSMSGRAWFNLRVSDFETLSDGGVADVGIDPADEKIMQRITDWLNHLGKLYSKVIIGGFSQGAILTSHSFYRLNFSPAGLLLLSGYLVAPSVFPTVPDPLKVPFFQSHGRGDQVLKVTGAQKLFDHLQSLGLQGTWSVFEGGHEIPMNVIAEAQTFVNSLLDPQG